MKQITLIFFALLLINSSVFSQTSNLELTAVAFNVRYNSSEDGVNIWENRKEWLAHSMRFFKVDIIGAQEVTYKQLMDMLQLLPSYGYIGVGREGENNGEFSPIFYNKTRLKVLKSETFWLSTTPNQVGSKGWDAALPRVVTWALFKDKISGKTFYHFNTHFDHRGKNARIESAKLLSKKINAIAISEPIFVTGDLNSSPESEAIKTLLESELKDPYLTLDKDSVYGPDYTFNGWSSKGKNSKNRIDYVLYKGAVEPLNLQILDGQRADLYISDHFPLILKAKLSL
ncbi:endonuclease/exonuclease/phosphatase family protein [Polaribacter sargassicola]|uniref:endonuclease/exonuclease/phosphatase family protein n=1 Tax=Polaribacter sargassicola TaxID=2836891 RepID=UPI001F2150EA|nr:endonuclease/exonuclease/phosphatase family protein [Polaribacter sp. DS7-9]MCG1035416.1 endonuclease/exonuclease/phosphatase family protein [Polaribacter sp. DS7-9]